MKPGLSNRNSSVSESSSIDSSNVSERPPRGGPSKNDLDLEKELQKARKDGSAYWNQRNEEEEANRKYSDDDAERNPNCSRNHFVDSNMEKHQKGNERQKRGAQCPAVTIHLVPGMDGTAPARPGRLSRCCTFFSNLFRCFRPRVVVNAPEVQERALDRQNGKAADRDKLWLNLK